MNDFGRRFGDGLRRSDSSGFTRAEVIKAGIGLGAGATVLGAVGCFGDDNNKSNTKKGGVLRFAFTDGNAKDDLDPTHSISEAAVILNGMLFESLLDADDQWAPKPQLVEDWEGKAGATQWTLHLRDGVEFHNGKPLTADDVVFSLRRHLDEKVGSTISSQFIGVVKAEGIKAVDKRTVRLELLQPNAFMPVTLALRHAGIIPAGTTEMNGVGTGPFRLKSFKPADSFEVVRNENYWDEGKPYLDGIRGVFMGETATKLQSLLEGSTQATDAIDFASLPLVQDKPEARIVRLRNNQIHAITFDSVVKPFDDPRVAQAVKLAVDRKAMVETVVSGFGTVTHDVPVTLDSPQFPGTLAEQQVYDPEQAASLLRQAGLEDGLEFELYTSEAGPGMVELAVVAKEQMAKANIRVTIKQFPPETYWTEAWGKKPNSVSWIANRHPYDNYILATQPTSPYNEVHYSNKQMDGLLNKAAGTLDDDQQAAIMQDIGVLYAETSTKLMPEFIDSLFVARQEVDGLNTDFIRHLDFRTAALKT